MNTTTASNDSTLTWEYCKELVKAFDKIPKQPVGIVCRPQILEWCRRNLLKSENEVRATYGLAAIPVYYKIGMDEEYKLFYDHDELRKYLA